MGISLDRSAEILDLPAGMIGGWRRQLAEPHRHYHTLSHIEHMLANLDPAEQSPEIIAAIWLHDIVYDPTRGDNEERSAEQARAQLASTRIDARLVSELVLGTKHHEAESDAQKILNDIDLGILGASAEAYDRYAGQIRQEYGFVGEADYRQGRAQILRGFDQRQIYQTARWQHREAQAHTNLRREIDQLGAGPKS